MHARKPVLIPKGKNPRRKEEGAGSAIEPGTRAIGKGGTQGPDGGRARGKTGLWSSPEMEEMADREERVLEGRTSHWRDDFLY